MWKIALILLSVFWMGTGKVEAANRITPTLEPTPTVVVTPTPAEIKENITEPSNEIVQDRLETKLRENMVNEWNGINSIRWLLRLGIERGIPASTVVLILMLPLTATLVGVLHYVVGVSGFGVFFPTALAVMLMATGIPGGIVMFGIILMITLGGGEAVKKLKLHFWPARAINLVLISLAAFGLMLVSSFIKVIDLTQTSIFTILFMIMLSEEFVRNQLLKSPKEARKLAVGTVALALVAAGVMRVKIIQEWVIVNPEMVVALVVILNIIVGKYSGLRLTEVKRFAKAIRK
jgi:hypothetical protein